MLFRSIDEPNTRFTTAEKQAIINFVKNGGGLFMVSDHTVSDRNNDGWDSPAIWNDLMTNNGLVSNPFGFSIDLTNYSQTTTNVLSGNLTNPILHGTQGNVTKLLFANLLEQNIELLFLIYTIATRLRFIYHGITYQMWCL